MIRNNVVSPRKPGGLAIRNLNPIISPRSNNQNNNAPPPRTLADLKKILNQS